MYNQSLEDIEFKKKLNLVWREPTGKRVREDDEEPPLKKPKAAKGAGAGTPSGTPTCNYCGRPHAGKCCWFTHPLRGSAKTIWALSEGGIRAQMDPKNPGYS